MTIDIITLIFFAYGFYVGYNRGIIQTIFNLLAYIFGILVAFKMTPVTANVLMTITGSENPLYNAAGFLLNITVIVFLMRMAATSIEAIFQSAYLGPVNRVLGGGITGAFFLLIYSVIVWFGVSGRLLNEGEGELRESKTYAPILKNLPTQAKDIAIRFKPLMEDLWNNSSSWIDKMQSYGLEKTESSPRIYDIEQEKQPNQPNDGKTRRASPDGVEYDYEEDY